MNNHNHPNSFGAEGVDHINISCSSDTKLGKVLDPSYYSAVNYPYLGKFKSVLNLWFWLKISPLDDSIRTLTCRKFKERIFGSGHTTSYVPNFKAVIALATYNKVMKYPDLIEELKNLPADIMFLSYYHPAGSAVRLCSGYAKVITEIAEILRTAARTGEEPDLSSLVSPDCSTDLSYLEPFIESRFGIERVNTLKAM